MPEEREDVEKDCPLCGETMHLKETQSVILVPGNPAPTTRVNREWICPECDYFEDVDEEPA